MFPSKLLITFFSPAIPLSKGEPMLPIRSPEDSQTTQSPESLPDSTPDIDQLGIYLIFYTV